ncbi:hypothetical protein CDAR_76741 [Caerostris darwini]|uniref:Secreted protein n=1 Tax=Caerostris darwini TaxID=1538125 RepID=A0AAV4QF37_9ARAC|nr:hypothetical protein CDAR_76741 [Caerostris darwini]
MRKHPARLTPTVHPLSLIFRLLCLFIVRPRPPSLPPRREHTYTRRFSSGSRRYQHDTERRFSRRKLGGGLFCEVGQPSPKIAALQKQGRGKREKKFPFFFFFLTYESTY